MYAFLVLCQESTYERAARKAAKAAKKAEKAKKQRKEELELKHADELDRIALSAKLSLTLAVLLRENKDTEVSINTFLLSFPELMRPAAKTFLDGVTQLVLEDATNTYCIQSERGQLTEVSLKEAVDKKMHTPTVQDLFFNMFPLTVDSQGEEINLVDYFTEASGLSEEEVYSKLSPSDWDQYCGILLSLRLQDEAQRAPAAAPASATAK